MQPSEARFVLRRSLLFMPGDSLRKIRKATALETDCVIMDLEDGVAVNRKDAARQTVAEALSTLDFGGRERLVRINPPDTPWMEKDLAVTLPARPDGYVLPKVQSPEEIRAVARRLAQAEERHGWPPGSLALLVVVETARGILALPEIARADLRLQALMFGAEDLAGDLGARRTREGWEVFHARSQVVIAAAAHGLQAIDMVFVDLADLAGLEAECTFGRQLGYTGKMAIHPRQLPVINRLFSPSSEEIQRAQALLQAFQAQEASGSGVFEWQGKMVDRPMVRAAQRILAQARAAGLI